MQRIDNKENTKSVVPGAIRPSSPKKRKHRHGIYFWLKTGQINPSIRGYRKLQKYLMDLERQLIEDAGGLENLTAAREILIRGTIKAYGVVLLSELFISKYSVLRPDQARRGVLQFQPILERSYWGAQQQIRQNLLALGLDRVAPPEPSLAEIIAQVDAEKDEAVGQEGQGKDAGEREIASPKRNGDDVSGQGEGEDK